MTPSQIDHLRRIDAHLAKLLSLAEKRTPGEWGSYENIGLKDTDIQRVGVTPKGIGSDVAALNMIGLSMDDCRCNAAFIASCAGNAEAGWKATRAAIADWLSLYNSTEGYADGAPDASAHDKLCNEVASICRINLQHILAAFPLEMLETTK